MEDQAEAEGTQGILRRLKADANSFLGKPGGLAKVLPSDFAKVLLHRDYSTISSELDEAFNNYFLDHDARFVAFVRHNFFLQWRFYSGNYLKSERVRVASARRQQKGPY
jgi:hypothetical protein